LNLTPEQKASIESFNTNATTTNENVIEKYVSRWSKNIGSLIRSGIELRGAKPLCEKLSRFQDFLVLGSGPSIQSICSDLPDNDWRDSPAILCGPTAYGALRAIDVHPTVILVADPSPTQYRHMVENLFDSPCDFLLPVTCDPAWYAKDSIIPKSRLFFYLPFFSWLGDTQIAFNAMLQDLFPEISQSWFLQAGSVANLAVHFADKTCGMDPSKRIYIAIENSWTEGGPYRAPLRFALPHYSESLRSWFNSPQNQMLTEPRSRRQTDMTSLNYAVSLFYSIHCLIYFEGEEAKKAREKRYHLVHEASSLYLWASPASFRPLFYPAPYRYLDSRLDVTVEHWTYKLVLDLIALTEKLMSELRDAAVEDALRVWKEGKATAVEIPVPNDTEARKVEKAIHDIDPSVKLIFKKPEVEKA